jgi:hypothetical protein
MINKKNNKNFAGVCVKKNVFQLQHCKLENLLNFPCIKLTEFTDATIVATLTTTCNCFYAL